MGVFGIPKDRLYVTYFGGDETYGIAADEEAKQLWIEAGCVLSHVIQGQQHDLLSQDSPPSCAALWDEGELLGDGGGGAMWTVLRDPL